MNDSCRTRLLWTTHVEHGYYERDDDALYQYRKNLFTLSFLAVPVTWAEEPLHLLPCLWYSLCWRTFYSSLTLYGRCKPFLLVLTRYCLFLHKNTKTDLLLIIMYWNIAVTILTASLDGSIGYLLPITEKMYRRLSMLQNVLSTYIPHIAGLNPKSYR